MIKKWFAALFMTLALGISAGAKEKLNVLYVGGSPDLHLMGLPQGPAPEEIEASVKKRMADFTKFLKQNFSAVTTVEGKDYTPGMSAGYDVTVFDGAIPAIKPEVRDMDDSGRVTKYEPAAYLPVDFTDAAVCIAEQSENLGRTIGSKNDWFCLCLDNYALGWDKDHPIFQGPFKVNLKPEMLPTPEHAFEYAALYGYELPAQTEMWMVSKAADQNANERIGMVSRPWGYLDSPDTEIISGGKCAKSIDAVAIGRHGNMLHWGFSAKPSDLTPAGRAALANAIVYAAKFKGKHPIARKLHEGIATRENADMNKYISSRDCWIFQYDSEMRNYLMTDSIIKEAKAKKERGETLSATEDMMLGFPPLPVPEQRPYADYLRGRFPKLYELFGQDSEEYARYFDKNKPYFYSTDDSKVYDLILDREAKGLGIANNDIRLLEKSIELLEAGGADAATGKTLLQRYTLCRFQTPSQWREWLNKNRDRLFFTEAGGWVWLVDTDDLNEPSNDYSVRKLERERAEAATAPQTQPRAKTVEEEWATDVMNPVVVKSETVKGPQGGKLVVVALKIHEGFHAYANVDDEDPFIPTEVTIELPDGIEADGPMKKPQTKPTANATTHYEGLIAFMQPIKGDAQGEATVRVRYQVCDANSCQSPVLKVLKVKI